MFWALAAVLITAFLATWLLRKYALATSLLDTPNARSSHTVPTPRGGGVAIVVTFLFVVPCLAAFGLLQWSWAWSLILPGAIVATLGFLDDHGHIAARWRLLGHFISAFIAVLFFGGLAPVSVFGETYDFGIVGDALAVVYLVWMLNLYNFMDGIDGIASVEAITACAGMCLIFLASDVTGATWSVAVLAAAVLGFLCWNFPPAKIFMGDAGSGFLGLSLGILSLQSAWIEPQFFWAWLILLGVFVCDATFTLIRRLLRGDKVYEAHRSHGYQFASRQYGKHLPVTVGVIVINFFWLLPIAFFVAKLELDGLIGLVIAYVPLLLLAVKFNSGALEHSD